MVGFSQLILRCSHSSSNSHKYTKKKNLERKERKKKEGEREMSGVMLGATEEVQEVQGEERSDSSCDGQAPWVQVNMAMDGWTDGGRDWSCE